MADETDQNEQNKNQREQARPRPPNSSFRRGAMLAIGAVLGAEDGGGPRKRLTFRASDARPGLPFRLRLHWLRAVEEITRGYKRRQESFPHKLLNVAQTLALAGDVIWMTHEQIADRSACDPRTVQRILGWLEDHAALTWDWTSRKVDGKWVRSQNRYRLSREIIPLIGTISKKNSSRIAQLIGHAVNRTPSPRYTQYSFQIQKESCSRSSWQTAGS